MPWSFHKLNWSKLLALCYNFHKMDKLALHGGTPVRDTMLPYGKQSIDEQDIDSVINTLKSDFLTTGPKVKEFEDKIARFVGAKYAVSFSSGTAALHGAAFAAGFGKEHEIITTPLSFAATANCILYQQATPVFVDINKNNLNLSYKSVFSYIKQNYVFLNNNLVNKKTKKRLKGIIPVHFAGHPVRLDKFYRLAKKYNLIIIEDAAHAFGSSLYGWGKWQPTGNCSFSHMAIFSFHPVKHITTGEGGIVTTNNRHLYNYLCQFRTHGITRNPDFLNNNPGPWHYEMQFLGNNYRLSDISAALGISQLRKSYSFLQKRVKIVSHYIKAFSNDKAIILPKEKKWARSSWHIFVVRLNLKNLKTTRDEIFQALLAENIGVNVHYIPIYKHPYYVRQKPYLAGIMDTTERVFKEIITLPLYPDMTEKDVNDVIKAVKKVLEFYRKK